LIYSDCILIEGTFLFLHLYQVLLVWYSVFISLCFSFTMYSIVNFVIYSRKASLFWCSLQGRSWIDRASYKVCEQYASKPLEKKFKNRNQDCCTKNISISPKVQSQSRAASRATLLLEILLPTSRTRVIADTRYQWKTVYSTYVSHNCCIVWVGRV